MESGRHRSTKNDPSLPAARNVTPLMIPGQPSGASRKMCNSGGESGKAAGCRAHVAEHGGTGGAKSQMLSSNNNIEEIRGGKSL